MTEVQKTIRMPKELLAKWLAALRSGEYKQGHTVLQQGSKFCCLGVLLHIAGESTHEAACLPTSAQLERLAVTFSDESGDAGDRSPWLPTLDDRADLANDKGVPFTRIADAIEACAEGY